MYQKGWKAANDREPVMELATGEEPRGAQASARRPTLTSTVSTHPHTWSGWVAETQRTFSTDGNHKIRPRLCASEVTRCAKRVCVNSLRDVPSATTTPAAQKEKLQAALSPASPAGSDCSVQVQSDELHVHVHENEGGGWLTDDADA